MKNIVLILVIVFGIVAVSFGQKTEKSYYPAYVANTKTLERIAKESQLRTKDFDVEIFILDYPVLDDLNQFFKKKKYSMINESLVKDIEETSKYKIFIFTNGKRYKVKKNHLVTRTL